MTVLLSSHILSELEPICDHLIILSAATVQIAGSTDALLEDHYLLVGSSDAPLPSDLEAITDRTTGRQRTLLVRGHPRDFSKEWEQVRAGLEVIVLAYLAKKSPNTAAARSHTNEGETS
jgi:ABC-2 type transport system ATP-binding protein